MCEQLFQLQSKKKKTASLETDKHLKWILNALQLIPRPCFLCLLFTFNTFTACFLFILHVYNQHKSNEGNGTLFQSSLNFFTMSKNHLLDPFNIPSYKSTTYSTYFLKKVKTYFLLNRSCKCQHIYSFNSIFACKYMSILRELRILQSQWVSHKNRFPDRFPVWQKQQQKKQNKKHQPFLHGDDKL